MPLLKKKRSQPKDSWQQHPTEIETCCSVCGQLRFDLSSQQSVHSFKKKKKHPGIWCPTTGFGTCNPRQHIACQGSGDVYMATSLDTRDFLRGTSLLQFPPRGASLWCCCAISQSKVLLQHHQRATKLWGEEETTQWLIWDYSCGHGE